MAEQAQPDATQKAPKERSVIARLLDFAGDRKPLTLIGCILVGISMLLSMVPYICVWLVVRDLVAVAPNWTAAGNITAYGWWAFAAALAGIVVYFAGLMCTHLVAFRIASNIRKVCSERLMHAPLGYFDNNASGLLRRRIDSAGNDAEQLLAHNLADLSGTVVMFIATIVLLVVFDWRMGLACFAAAIISVACMAAMMAGKGAHFMAEYQAALEDMSKKGTEYVRGIPVVKVFQQTVDSFTAFRESIDAYGIKAEEYQGEVCEIPQSVNLTVTEGTFLLLIPVALLIAPGALASGQFARFVTDFAFYAMFSAVMSTALAKIMFAAGGMMQADNALARIEDVLSCPQILSPDNPQEPADASIAFEQVCFSYEGAEQPALAGVSFTVPAGSTVALVGPSGGGKTTAASLIPRFWDVDEGAVRVGGVDVRNMDPHVLMDQVAFVFQSNRLFKASIFENVRAAKPDAMREQVLDALAAAQCDDIIAKLPDGIDTVIGTGGTYLSGGEVQRISLARAILKDAPIVVLDEATAFADPENEALIQAGFANLAKGRTVVMIAHRLSTVVHADEIIVLDSGRVAEQGTHDELVAQGGLYSRMWDEYAKSVQWKIAREVA